MAADEMEIPLSLPVSRVATICGYNPYRSSSYDVVELLAQCIYSGRPDLLIADTVALGNKSPLLMTRTRRVANVLTMSAKSHENLISVASRISISPPASRDAHTAMQNAVETAVCEATCSGALSADDGALLLDGLARNINCGYGEQCESLALQEYQKQFPEGYLCDCNKLSITWRFPPPLSSDDYLPPPEAFDIPERAAISIQHVVNLARLEEEVRSILVQKIIENVIEDLVDRLDQSCGGATSARSKCRARIKLQDVFVEDWVGNEVGSESASEALIFPDTLSKQHRHAVHKVAEALGLHTFSFGEGIRRRVAVLLRGSEEGLSFSPADMSEMTEVSAPCYFSLVGIPDGVMEFPSPRPTIEDPDHWELTRVIVEIKTRVHSPRRPPPLFDQIQLVIYLLMTGCSLGHLVQAYPDEKEDAPQIAVHVVDLEDDSYRHKENFKTHIIPYLYGWIAVVRKFRNNDGERLLWMSATDEEKWARVQELCWWLDPSPIRKRSSSEID